MPMLGGRCALVTGSTQGLGYATAETLAAAGCNIVLSGLGDRDEIEAKRHRLEATHGVRALYHGADLTAPAEIAGLVAAAEDAFGAVDILVNNAVVRHFARIEAFPPEAWDEAVAVNLSAAFHATRLVLPRMRARNFGRIVNVSSVYGLFGTVERVAYVTTKTALIGFTRAVALETVDQDITCNAICPGSAPTPSIKARVADLMARDGLPEELAVKKFLAARQPAGRFVSLERIAALIEFLCGPAGADITGAAIPMDAGWSAS
jgi:3-hydroxybutyrate dehydrogenase